MGMRRLAVAGFCLALLPAASMPPQSLSAAAGPPTPQVLFGDLFIAVQKAQLFADSKTFADAVPMRSPAEILTSYHDSKPVSPEALRSFVAANFTVPAQAGAPELSTERVAITRHIDALWDQLTRTTDTAPRYSSLLPLPKPYVVPGGRFREMYYWDSADTPRDESYREDTQLAVHGGQESRSVYRELRAAAESGWDFSSRWFSDGRSLATINTIEIIPIDLNSLLFGLENAISAGCARAGEERCAREFSHRAAARRDAVNRYLWDATAGVYHDYQWVKRAQVPRISAATLYPLFAGLAAKPQALGVASAVSRDLLMAV